MKHTLIFASALLGLASFTAADKAVWNVDNSHAKLGFVTRHLMISDLEGQFKKFETKITASKDDFSDASVELSADVASISTDMEMRDNHLKSADFFDATTYPTLTFKSKTFKKVGDKKYKVTGPLTMHGVTKDVELDAILGGTVENPMSKKMTAGFKVTGKIKRSDFGIGGSMPNEVVADEVTLNANAEFIKQ